MVKIRRLKNSDLEQVIELSVNEDQLKYVGTIEALLEEASDTWHFHVITDGETVVGFFNIDIDYSHNYAFAKPNELGLRAFFIDSSHQGKGYGKSAIAALLTHLQRSYDQHSSIALTVNQKNLGAYKCYLNGGFEDTGELFYGGAAGPQHIMRLNFGSVPTSA